MQILVTIPNDASGKTFLTPIAVKALEELRGVTYNPYARNYTDEELK